MPNARDMLRQWEASLNKNEELMPQVQPTPQKSGFLRRALGDTAISALNAAVSVPESLVGMVDIPTGGAASELAHNLGVDFKKTKEITSSLYSPEYQEAARKVAEAKGFVGTIKAMVENPSTILQQGIESSGSMLPAAAIATATGGAGVPLAIAAGAGEGLVSAGQHMAQTYQEKGRADYGDSAKAIASGLGTGLIGMLSGGLSNKFKIADVDQILAGGINRSIASSLVDKAAGTSTKKGIIRNLIEAGLVEGFVEELPQSAQEQIWANLSTGKRWDEGVSEAAASGALVGFGMGAVGGGYHGVKAPAELRHAESILTQPIAVDESGKFDPAQYQVRVETAASMVPILREQYGDAAVENWIHNADILINSNQPVTLSPELFKTKFTPETVPAQEAPAATPLPTSQQIAYNPIQGPEITPPNSGFQFLRNPETGVEPQAGTEPLTYAGEPVAPQKAIPLPGPTVEGEVVPDPRRDRFTALFDVVQAGVKQGASYESLAAAISEGGVDANQLSADLKEIGFNSLREYYETVGRLSKEVKNKKGMRDEAQAKQASSLAVALESIKNGVPLESIQAEGAFTQKPSTQTSIPGPNEATQFVEPTGQTITAPINGLEGQQGVEPTGDTTHKEFVARTESLFDIVTPKSTPASVIQDIRKSGVDANRVRADVKQMGFDSLGQYVNHVTNLHKQATKLKNMKDPKKREEIRAIVAQLEDLRRGINNAAQTGNVTEGNRTEYQEGNGTRQGVEASSGNSTEQGGKKEEVSPRYSKVNENRTAPLTVAQVNASIKEALDKLPEDIHNMVEVVNDPEAFWDGVFVNGKVMLNAAQIYSASRAREVLLDHELRHVGLSQMFGGPKKLHEAMKKAFAGREAEVAAFAIRHGYTTSIEEAVEEYIVSKVKQSAKDAPLLAKIVTVFRRWLRGHGFSGLNFSNAEMLEMISRSGDVTGVNQIGRIKQGDDVTKTYQEGQVDESELPEAREMKNEEVTAGKRVKVIIDNIKKSGLSYDEYMRQLLEGGVDLDQLQTWARKAGYKSFKSMYEASTSGSMSVENNEVNSDPVRYSKVKDYKPTKTVTAYKLFKIKNNNPGKLYPLFVNANNEVPIGEWLKAESGPMTDKGKVKSSLGPLAYRPGWHAGEYPVATHIGEGGNPPTHRPSNQVWVEVELAADKDWQSIANQNGTNDKGKLVAVKAHITDQIPHDGYYKYKTNSNMTGSWLIGGDMKVVRVLSDSEVSEINKAGGVADLPRKEPFDLEANGFKSDSRFSKPQDMLDSLGTKFISAIEITYKGVKNNLLPRDRHYDNLIMLKDNAAVVDLLKLAKIEEIKQIAKQNVILDEMNDIKDKWVKSSKGAGQVDAVNEYAATATIWGIHGDKTLKDQEYTIASWISSGMQEKTGLTLKEAHSILTSQYAKLDPEVRKAYKLLVSQMKSLREQDYAARVEFIKNLPGVSEDRKAGLLRRIDNFYRTIKGPYLPLGRFGRHIVQVVKKNADGTREVVYNSTHETEYEAMKLGRAMQDKYKSGYKVEVFDNRKIFSRERINITLDFINKVKSSLSQKSFSLAKKTAVSEVKSYLDDTGVELDDVLNNVIKSIRSSTTMGELTDAVDRLGKISEDRRLISETLVGISDALKQAGLDEDSRSVIDSEFESMFLDSQPESSTYKNSITRKAIAGFEKDMLRSAIGYADRHAKSIAYLTHGANVDNAYRDMNKRAKTLSDSGEIGMQETAAILRSVKDLQETKADIVGEKVHPFVSKLNTMAFFKFLTSPSTYIVQSTQPWTITLPKLAARYGVAKAIQMMGKYHFGQVTGKYTNNAIETFDQGEKFKPKSWNKDDPFSLTKYIRSLELSGRAGEASTILGRLTPGEVELYALKRSMLDGAINVTQSHEARKYLMGGATTNETLKKMADGASYFMQASELTSRKAAFLAAFECALNEGKGISDSVKAANQVVRETLYDYSQLNRPKVLTGNIGRLVGQFRVYQMQTIAHLVNLLTKAINVRSANVSKEDIAEARKELAYIVMANSMLAGAAGIPFVGTMKTLLSAVAALFSAPDDPFDLVEEAELSMLESTSGQVALKGLPMLLGMDLSRRVGMGGVEDLISGEPPEKASAVEKANWYAAKILGPGYAVASSLVLGSAEAMKTGNWSKAAQTILPKAMADVARAMNLADNGLKDSTGRTVIKAEDVSQADVMLMFAGVNPTEISVTSRRNKIDAKINDRIESRQRLLRNKMYDAIKDGDYEAIQESMAKIVEFNKTVPLFAIKTGDLQEGVKQSLRKAYGIQTRSELKIEASRDMR